MEADPDIIFANPEKTGGEFQPRRQYFVRIARFAQRQ